MSSSWPALTIRESAAAARAAGGRDDHDHPSTSSPPPPPPPAPARARRRQPAAGGSTRAATGGSSSGSNPANAADAETLPTTTPTVETFSAKRDERITVATPPDGFLFDLRLSARIPHPPDRVFEVLADEEAHKIFRGIKETVSRDVLSDDGRGKRSVLVAHRAGLRVLGLTAAFETRLRVDEDRRAGTIRFRGADADDASGGGGDAFMRRFEGSWTVAPFDARSLSRAYGGGGSGGGAGGGAGDALWSLMDRFGLGGALGFFGGLGGGGGTSSSGTTLVTLEQALAPRLLPPRPLQPLVRALCGRTLQHMVEDLKGELERRERERRRGGGGGGGGGGAAAA